MLFCEYEPKINEKNNHAVLTKHIKYKSQYKKNTIYWGLGIENEIYLEFMNHFLVCAKSILTNQQSERYSVNYYKNYKSDELIKALNHFITNSNNNIIKMPLLLNSHSFMKTDKWNQSKTLYTKLGESNPEFIGETLLESLQKENSYFKESYDKNWCFDGDSIEFMTIHFFNTRLSTIIDELNNSKKTFIKELNDSFKRLNIFREYGPIRIMRKNHPFGMYMTNIPNIAMFNNGTLHYNLTLPCNLDENGNIKDLNKFKKDHEKAIKIIQWMEPFLIAIYNTPDPFSKMNTFMDKHKYSKVSQRCAISRYISIGTFNSDEMSTGKILTLPIKDIICNNIDNWWFNEFYKQNAYNKLEEIGLDINYNKHYNHGIELRFFDNMATSNEMKESFEFIIYLMDIILESDNIYSFGNPIINPIWNDIVLNIMIYGKDYILNDEQKELYENLFSITLTNQKVENIYYEIFEYIKRKENRLGNGKRQFSSLAIEDEENEDIINIEKYHKCCTLF